jgi:hypothetical protein
MKKKIPPENFVADILTTSSRANAPIPSFGIQIVTKQGHPSKASSRIDSKISTNMRINVNSQNGAENILHLNFDIHQKQKVCF